MADDKSNVGGQDRSRVAGDQDYEVRYFAERHGISTETFYRWKRKYGGLQVSEAKRLKRLEDHAVVDRLLP